MCELQTDTASCYLTYTSISQSLAWLSLSKTIILIFIVKSDSPSPFPLLLYSTITHPTVEVRNLGVPTTLSFVLINKLLHLYLSIPLDSLFFSIATILVQAVKFFCLYWCDNLLIGLPIDIYFYSSQSLSYCSQIGWFFRDCIFDSVTISVETFFRTKPQILNMVHQALHFMTSAGIQPLWGGTTIASYFTNEDWKLVEVKKPT